MGHLRWDRFPNSARISAASSGNTMAGDRSANWPRPAGRTTGGRTSPTSSRWLRRIVQPASRASSGAVVLIRLVSFLDQRQTASAGLPRDSAFVRLIGDGHAHQVHHPWRPFDNACDRDRSIPGPPVGDGWRALNDGPTTV